MASRKDKNRFQTSRSLGGYDPVDGFIPYNYEAGSPGGPNKASRQRAAKMSASRKKQILNSAGTAKSYKQTGSKKKK
jgi:hypothetical protein